MQNGEKITGVGRISRVTAKFCYVSSPSGSIFCPLAHAVRADLNVPNLCEAYQAGDQVTFTAVKQEAKNGCSLLALKVRHKHNEKTERSTDILHGNAIVNVVTETFAYGTVFNEPIFIPGSAFSAEEVTRLNSYLISGDSVKVSYKRQAEHNGCQFVAVSAAKISQDNKIISGCGRILSVSEHSAVVLSDSQENIICSILTWTGGCGPRHCTWLTELLSPGEMVAFTALRWDGNLRVIDWYSLKLKPRSSLTNAETQTMACPSTILIDILRPVIEEMSSEKPILKMVGGIARDNIRTLKMRHSGMSIVCAQLVSISPPMIKDNSGVQKIPPIPPDQGANAGDVCLFLFDCTPRPPVCSRVTVIPNCLVPLYMHQCEEYWDNVKKITSSKKQSE